MAQFYVRYICILLITKNFKDNEKEWGKDQILNAWLRNFYFLHMQWRTTDESLRRKEALWWHGTR